MMDAQIGQRRHGDHGGGGRAVTAGQSGARTGPASVSFSSRGGVRMDSDSLEARMARLERSCRRWQGLTFTALVLAGLGLGAAALRGEDLSSGTLVASRLVLTDARGQTRATLDTDAQGNAGLVLRDGEGRPRALLGVGEDGSPRLRFSTAEGQSLAELMVYSDEAPRLTLSKPGGGELFAVGLQVDGSSRLELSDADGRPRAILGADEHGSPGLVLRDRKGLPRVALRVSPSDGASLVVEGQDGAVFRAPGG
ncbi:hypothetical protein BHS05_32165 [Myxococcus xanthus]|nr:hypothetical protein BHS05_32165 [Myxococcus xanthus]